MAVASSAPARLAAQPSCRRALWMVPAPPTPRSAPACDVPCRRRRRQRRCGLAAAAASAGGTTAADLKERLLQAVSRSNNPRPGDDLPALAAAVEDAAAALAATNPTPDAALSPLLPGAWALLYSGRSRRLVEASGMPTSADAPGASLRQAMQGASDRAYSTFYRYVPLLAGSAVGTKARRAAATNLQVLTPDDRVDNIVSAKAGPLPVRLCVSGTVERVPPPPGRPASCVAVRFDSFTVKAGSLREARLSLAWLSPLGYVSTIYLDADTRISCGDKGGLFVLRRVPGEGGGGGSGGDAR